MNEYWFKPREFGYGATPIAWQGWAVTIATMVVVVLSTLLVPLLADGTAWALGAAVIDVAALVALWFVARNKTDGELRWRWGKD
jgi:Na+/melibiose symporter-like transporter